MTKTELIKLLEVCPDDTEIAIYNFDEGRTVIMNDVDIHFESGIPYQAVLGYKREGE